MTDEKKRELFEAIAVNVLGRVGKDDARYVSADILQAIDAFFPPPDPDAVMVEIACHRFMRGEREVVFATGVDDDHKTRQEAIDGNLVDMSYKDDEITHFGIIRAPLPRVKVPVVEATIV